MEKYNFFICVPQTHIMLVTSRHIRQTQRVDSMVGKRFSYNRKARKEKPYGGKRVCEGQLQAILHK